MSQPLVATILSEAIDRLTAADVAKPARDARKLLTVATGDRFLISSDQVDLKAAKRFADMVEKRAARVPVSHIIGYREFYGRKFNVNSDVLDPRPETECLIEEALKKPFARVLDLGTGSGAILLTLLAECPEATGVGTDISQEALNIAIGNPVEVDFGDRARLEISNWFDDVSGRFDLIVSNPPYIAADEMDDLQPEVRVHEPRLALTDEADGLSAYAAITEGAPDHLAPGGRLLVEIGPAQGAPVREMFLNAGLMDVAIVKDLDGRDRVVVGVSG